MSNNLKNALNVQVANFGVLYQKLHHYHWFVKGSSFFTLHEKFEEDYDETTGHFDDVAERLIQIGGVPASTLRDYLELSTLSENQHEAKTENEMVAAIVADYKHLISEFKTVIELADEANDNVTEDLFIGISASLEKKVWLYESFLG